jgi:hypothetical protein
MACSKVVVIKHLLVSYHSEYEMHQTDAYICDPYCKFHLNTF